MSRMGKISNVTKNLLQVNSGNAWRFVAARSSPRFPGMIGWNDDWSFGHEELSIICRSMGLGSDYYELSQPPQELQGIPMVAIFGCIDANQAIEECMVFEKADKVDALIAVGCSSSAAKPRRHIKVPAKHFDYSYREAFFFAVIAFCFLFMSSIAFLAAWKYEDYGDDATNQDEIQDEKAFDFRFNLCGCRCNLGCKCPRAKAD
uniref:Uncharacterized protein n=1 Tax=Lotharella oceanica TaxID=641309 RepID=A0A7S2XF85_9EUKA|mmetsp:Transcript_3669/g.7087  ORF Transcript_3669/g.7087 Transcript_3669/m.7087 type:complete len:204 (+) Transcript_3669:338-949(+)